MFTISKEVCSQSPTNYVHYHQRLPNNGWGRFTGYCAAAVKSFRPRCTHKEAFCLGSKQAVKRNV